jgi:hypothetical protein
MEHTEKQGSVRIKMDTFQLKKKVKQSHYKLEVAQRVLGS